MHDPSAPSDGPQVAAELLLWLRSNLTPVELERLLFARWLYRTGRLSERPLGRPAPGIGGAGGAG